MKNSYKKVFFVKKSFFVKNRALFHQVKIRGSGAKTAIKDTNLRYLMN